MAAAGKKPNGAGVAPCRTTAEDGGCCDCTRRSLLQLALVTGAGLPLQLAAADDSDAAYERPQPGDHFVFAEPPREGEAITVADIPLGGPQVQAWAVDPTTKTVRSGSRLNRVLLLRFDPASLGDKTRPHAAEGIVAYSAICTHAQCYVSAWFPDKQVLHCPCHQSEYDPRHDARVVSGPAPRPLPALPVKIANGVLTVAGEFLGRVGMRRT